MTVVNRDEDIVRSQFDWTMWDSDRKVYATRLGPLLFKKQKDGVRRGTDTEGDTFTISMEIPLLNEARQVIGRGLSEGEVDDRICAKALEYLPHARADFQRGIDRIDEALKRIR